MAEAPRNTPPMEDWRYQFKFGLTMCLAVLTAEGVEKVLEPSLGYWGAFAVSIVAAGVGAGLVVLVVNWKMASDWRHPLTHGLVMGLGIATLQGVRKGLEPSLGYLGAFAVGVVVVGLIALAVRMVKLRR